MLRVIEEHSAVPCETASRYGRPAYSINPFIRAFWAKSYFRLLTMDDLRKRLISDPNLRRIYGGKFRSHGERVLCGKTCRRSVTRFYGHSGERETLQQKIGCSIAKAGEVPKRQTKKRRRTSTESPARHSLANDDVARRSPENIGYTLFLGLQEELARKRFILERV